MPKRKLVGKNISRNLGCYIPYHNIKYISHVSDNKFYYLPNLYPKSQFYSLQLPPTNVFLSLSGLELCRVSTPIIESP
jgi:hypothetical protein